MIITSRIVTSGAITAGAGAGLLVTTVFLTTATFLWDFGAPKAGAEIKKKPQ